MVARSLRQFLLVGVSVMLALLISAEAPRASAQSGTEKRVIVKFVEGSGLRLRGGALVTTAATSAPVSLSPLQGAFSNYPSLTITRLFTRPEASLDNERQAALSAAATTSSSAPANVADLNLYYALTLPATATDAEVDALIADLSALPIVQTAYRAPLPAPPGSRRLQGVTPDFTGSQFHLTPATVGTGARLAWERAGGRGDGVRVIDIEYDWNVDHEDLPLDAPSLLAGEEFTLFGDDHGTAVVGILGGFTNNGRGIEGNVPLADHKLVATHYSGSYNVANAVSQAVSNSQPGDVILIEQQAVPPVTVPPCPSGCTCVPDGERWVPVEFYQAEYDAIAAATAAGRIVVLTAGNGFNDLDWSGFTNKFNRAVRDSGAIYVGAGQSSNAGTPRAPHCYSNFGSRVDVQGIGDSIVTTGYGDLFDGGSNALYTSSFGGTSSSGPIVAGAVASLQGMAKQNGFLMTAADIRKLLRDTGTAQASSPRQIGPLPNLANVVSTAGFSRPIERASLSSAGGQITQGITTYYPLATSSDGRYVAFSTSSNELVSGDTNAAYDVFVRDTMLNTTIRASVTNAGAQANGGSFWPSISADGRYVVFDSAATNLVTGDTNAANDIFVRDLVSGTTQRVSLTNAGAQSNGFSYQPAIAANGRYIVFSSIANNLVASDTNSELDIFVRDTVSNTTTRVSVSSASVQSNGYSQLPSISADGRYVAFGSGATNLVAGDTNTAEDVFLRDRTAGQTYLISANTSGGIANNWSSCSAISDDGRYVAFIGLATDLVGTDTNSFLDIFRRDVQTNTTTMVSLSDDEVQGNGDAGFTGCPTISRDGRYVAFTTFASNFLPSDMNGVDDGFVRDVALGRTVHTSRSATSQPANGFTYLSRITGNGQSVAYFSNATMLVTGDTNAIADVFLAPVSFLTLPTPPPTTTPSGIVTGTLTPEYVWTHVPGATTYFLVTNNLDSSTTVISTAYTASACAGTTCKITPPMALANSIPHAWYVAAGNELGYGNYSAASWFVPAVIPAAPTIVGPSGLVAYGGTPIQPMYTWSKVAGGVLYALAVYDLDTGTSQLFQVFEGSAICGASTCSAAPTGGSAVLTSGKTYGWYVAAVSYAGPSAWSSGAVFVPYAPPGVPTLVSPSGTASSNPTYTWNKVQGAVFYYVLVKRSDQTQMVGEWVNAATVCGATTCSFTPAVNLGPGAYGWWVAASNPAGTSALSAMMAFSVGSSAPIAPTFQP